LVWFGLDSRMGKKILARIIEYQNHLIIQFPIRNIISFFWKHSNRDIKIKITLYISCHNFYLNCP
jgi:hypothetical protein